MKSRVLAVLLLFPLLAAGAAAQDGEASGQDAGPDDQRDGARGDEDASNDGSKDDERSEDGEARSSGAKNATENGTAAQGPDDACRPAQARNNTTTQADCERQERERDALAVAYCRQHPDDARCEELRERLEAFCEDHPRVQACQELPPPPGPGHTGAFVACMRAAPDASLEELARHREACCTTYGGNNDAVKRACAVQQALQASVQGGRHVAFDPMEDGLGIENHTVDGHVVLERLRYLPKTEAPQVSAERVGARLEVRIGDEAALAIIDNPTGLISGRGTGSFEMRLPENTTIVSLEEGWRVSGDGWQAILLARSLVQNGPELTAQGFISYHVKPEAPARRAPSLSADAFERAAAKGHLGAEVSIRRQADVDGPVDVLQYDDVHVEVELPEQAATSENPIRVEVSAELEEGRTIVLDLDPSLLASTSPEELELRYYDVSYENGIRRAVEVGFASAASLDDVMDPTDDDGEAEYWVVSDANGVHVLVSVPHWSIHAFTVASLAELAKQPSVLAGAIAGAAGAVIATVALLRPRDEDE